MWSGIGILLLVFIPLLSLGGWCLQLACRLSGADVPGLGASVGWVLFMGGAARGGALAVQNQVAPQLGAGASPEAMLLQVACYLLIPFLVLRLYVCKETGLALRVHALNLVFTGALAAAGFALYHQLA